MIQFLRIILLYVLKFLLLHAKANHKIIGVNIFQYTYLYTVYADNTAFLLKYKNYQTTKANFYFFSILSKVQLWKMWNCRNWSPEKCKVEVCGMRFVDLCKDAIRITGVHFSCNKTKQDEKNVLETETKIQNIFRIVRMWSLTLESRIIVFKTFPVLCTYY